MIDKLYLVSDEHLVVYFVNRDPVTITGPDAMALWLWLQSPAERSYCDTIVAFSAETEDTVVTLKAA